MKSKQRSVEEIESDIERIRMRIDATLDELESRLTPRELLHDGLGAISGMQAGRYLLGAAGMAKRFPVPAAIAGADIAGLMVVARMRANGKADDAIEDSALPRSAKSILDAGKEKLGEFGQKAVDAASAVRDKAAESASSAMKGSKTAAYRTRDGVVRAGQAVGDYARARPVATKAAGFAIGIAVAAALPYLWKRLR